MARRGIQTPEFRAQQGKGRPKGTPNRLTKYKPLAEKIINGLVMEQAELLARLTKQGRADLGHHLKFDENGKLIGVEVNQAHTDTLRDLELKAGPTNPETGKPFWTETKLKVADPMPALSQLAKYHGLERAAEGQLSVKVWAAIFERAGLDGEKLRAAALATLQIEE